jgi:HYDIN/CFA65/VesB-like, Ig-like domain/Abnormal spindle-like microcephaly-assoc'd, ASPM-SPD-2-Hydin/Right handed beta helix region
MIVALVVVLLVCVSSCASSFAARKQQQLAAPSSVDFGSIAVGSSSTQSLTVTNMGASNTTISGATVTGSGFSFKGPVLPLNLQPGTSATFSVSFLPPTPGSAQGRLSLSGKQNSVTVALGGTGVQPSISIAPGSISFGNVQVGLTSSQTITLSNPGNATLDITQFTAPSAGFSMTGLSAPSTLAPGQTAKFSVSFTPGTVGSQASSVTLFSNAPTSPVQLSLSGAGVQPQPQISVQPGSLAFGSVNVGSSGKQSLTVSNPGSTALSISAANMTRADFATVGLSLPMTVAAGGSGTITVDFVPSASGSVTGSLSLVSNAPTSPTVIALSGTGTAPTGQLSANPSSLNLGTEAVGSTSSKQNVTLTNSSSTTSITISNITVSGPFAFSGTTLPVTLNPSSSLILSVTFTPTVSGAITGTLAVSSNSGNSPTAITLAGTGTSSALTPSGPIVINGQNGQVIQGLKITSTTGDCVQITNSTNITIQNSEIGPCAGNGINISGSNGVQIYDSYIHPETQSPSCCDNNDGILGQNGSQNLTIQGNVIAYSESNIEILDSSNVTVTGNFLLNPRNDASNASRGQNFQCWTGGLGTGCSGMTLQNNYALSSTDTTLYLYPEQQEDSINFGYTNGAVVQNNYVTGGHSSSGCGLIADSTANSIHFLSNLVLNTGQCGIGIADGTNQLVDSNKVYNTTPVAGGGNTAIYTWKQYSNPCGPTTISNNIADEIKPDGSHSGFWDGGGCSTTLSGNIFSQQADTLLTPTSTVFAPPLIPPKPKNCVVISPYSTQTSLASCVP